MLPLSEVIWILKGDKVLKNWSHKWVFYFQLV